MRQLMGLWGLAVGLAALWTGARQGFCVGTMVGFLPPHYGYSAYAVVPLLFISKKPWMRWAAGAALLLSGNRASWISALAGTASRLRGEHVGAKLLLVLALAIGGVVGGNTLKTRGSWGDSARVMIWKTAAHYAAERPWTGWGPGQFYVGVGGLAITRAHSDVLQLAVDRGFLWAGVAVYAVLLGLWVLPAGPEKAVLVALTAQSVVDNRLHHPACAALYLAAWLAAWRARRRP